MANITELIVRLKDEVSANSSKIERSLGGLNNQIRNFAGVFGVGLGVGTLIGFGKHLLDVGDKLSDLSDQTRISIGVLAGLKPMADQSGTSLESLATGVNRLMISLAEGQDGTGEQAQALKTLGITTDEVRKSMSDPEGFLELFAKKMGNVTTQSEKLATAKRLAGKASAELLPMLMMIAERGLPQVSKETEEAYKALGDLKDRLVEMTAEATNFWAALIGRTAKALGFGKSFSDEIREDIQRAETSLAILKSMAQRGSAVAKPMEETEKRLTALHALLEKVEDGEKRRAGQQTAAAKPPDKHAKQWLKSLIDQNDQLELQFIKLTQSEGAAHEYAKTTLLAKLGTSALTGEMVMQLDRWDQLVEDIKQATFELNKLGEIIKMWEQDLGEIAAGPQEALEKIYRPLEEQIVELQKTVTLETMSESQRRVAETNAEMEKRIEIVQRAIEEQILTEQEAAVVLGQIYESATKKAKEKTEEMTEFTRRAFERSFDAVADALQDFMHGQFKGWADLGNRIKQVLDSIAANYITTLGKTMLLGKDYGTPGAPVGGLLGNLVGAIFGADQPVYGPGPGQIPEYQSGGIVGLTRVSMRRYDPTMFAGARRYQDGGFPGLGSDEVPAILHRGEEVIPAGERGRGGNIYNTWHVRTNDAGSFLRSQAQVEGMVARATRRGQRKL